MTDDSEIALHREQIAKNRTLLEELKAGNTAGGNVFPRLVRDRALQGADRSVELIVAASEKL